MVEKKLTDSEVQQIVQASRAHGTTAVGQALGVSHGCVGALVFGRAHLGTEIVAATRLREGALAPLLLHCNSAEATEPIS